jgi:hypothetical protein
MHIVRPSVQTPKLPVGIDGKGGVGAQSSDHSIVGFAELSVSSSLGDGIDEKPTANDLIVICILLFHASSGD